MLGLVTVAHLAGSICREALEAKGVPNHVTRPTLRRRILEALMSILIAACFVIPAVAFTLWVLVMAWLIGISFN